MLSKPESRKIRPKKRLSSIKVFLKNQESIITWYSIFDSVIFNEIRRCSGKTLVSSVLLLGGESQTQHPADLYSPIVQLKSLLLMRFLWGNILWLLLIPCNHEMKRYWDSRSPPFRAWSSRVELWEGIPALTLFLCELSAQAWGDQSSDIGRAVNGEKVVGSITTWRKKCLENE